MTVDGIAASQCIDRSGEILDIEGVDCHKINRNDGIPLKWEYRDDAVVGRLTYLKKILTLSDCENDRQRMYWNKTECNPFIYVTCRLNDGDERLTSFIRDNVIRLGFGIGGFTTRREGNVLKASCFEELAITCRPIDKATMFSIVGDNDGLEGNQ
jgi:hypothetical protein